MKKILFAAMITLAACASVAPVPADASIPGETSRATFTASGTGPYTFTFPVSSASHIEVFVNDVKQMSGYTVTLNASQSVTPGGHVDFSVAPTAGLPIRIDRTRPITQTTVLPVYGPYKAKDVERAFDAQTEVSQQLSRKIGDEHTAWIAGDAAEAAARTAADALLQTSITAETAARIAADADLRLAIGTGGGGGGVGDYSSVLVYGTTTARQLRYQLADLAVNVKNFGALCNGTADDSAAIQAAINQNANGTIYIPAGTCRIASTLHITTSLTMKGAGRATAILRPDNGITAFHIENTGGVAGTGINYLDLEDFAISFAGHSDSNIAITAGSPDHYIADFSITRVNILAPDGFYQGRGLSFDNVMTGKIDSCRVTGFDHGLHYDGTPNNAISVINSHLTMNHVGLYSNGGEVWLTNNVIEGQTENGIVLIGTTAFIKGNHFENDASGGVVAQVRCAAGSGSNFLSEGNSYSGGGSGRDIVIDSGSTYNRIASIGDNLLSGVTNGGGVTNNVTLIGQINPPSGSNIGGQIGVLFPAMNPSTMALNQPIVAEVTAANGITINSSGGWPTALGAVASISGTTTIGHNLRGTVEVNGATVTGSVTFGQAEPSSTYFLSITPSTSSGTPAAGSNRVVSMTKNTTGFSFTVEVQPGAGSVQNFDWILIR